MKSKQKLTKEKELSSKKKQKKNQKKSFKPSSREEMLARGKKTGITGFILPMRPSEPEMREATEADWRMFEEAEKGLHEAVKKHLERQSKV
jgi:hypothetical protein